MSDGSKTTKIVLVGVLILVAGFFGYRRACTGGSSNANDNDKPAEVTGDKARDQRVALGLKRRAAQGRGAKARLGGVVLDDQSGQPIAGATVSFVRKSLEIGQQFSPGVAGGPLMVVSDENGRFDIGGLRAGLFSVTASARLYVPLAEDELPVAPGQTKDNLEIRLTRGGHRLFGTVIDIGGGPIASAYVRASRITAPTVKTVFRAPASTRTDVDGNYEMWLTDGGYLIEAGQADYVTSRKGSQVSGTDREEDFTLVPGAVINGRVLVSGTNAPVSGAMVTRSPGGGRLTGVAFGAAARTDASGKFVLRGLRSGEISLIAVARGYASRTPTSVYVDIAETRDDITIHLDAAYSISGFVVRAEDETQPVPQALVAAYNLTKRLGAATSDLSGLDGYFEIIGVMPGTYTIAAAGEGMYPNLFGETLEVVDKDIDGLLVEVSGGVTIAGRVNPPVPAFIRLEMKRDSFSFDAIPRIAASQLARTTADEQGNFELSGLSTGEVIVVAEHQESGRGKIEIDVSSPGQRDLVVELEATGSIAGTLTNAAGRPVARARVRARGAASDSFGFGSAFGERNTVITNTDGTFVIRGLGPASYGLSARKNGERLPWAARTVGTGETPNGPKKIELGKSEDKTGVALVVEVMDGVIAGRVVGADGATVADAWVKIGRIDHPWAGRRNRRGVRVLRNGEEKEADIETDSEDWTGLDPALTDPEGSFRFETLRDGEYWLSATGPGGSGYGSVRPIKTGSSSLTVVLEPSGSASGVVTSSGKPLTDYTLIVEGPRAVRMQVSNPQGAYSIERLPSGRYAFEVQSELGRAREAVTITGAALVHNMEVVNYATITGTVVGAKSGNPIAGLPVFAMSPGSDTDSLGVQVMTGDVPTTDENGRFTVTRQGEGEAAIIVLDSGPGGFQPVAFGNVMIDGAETDAGTLKAVEDPSVEPTSQGKFGFRVAPTTWATRPEITEPGPLPAGADVSTKYLWVLSTEAGGAAASAGVQPSDRIIRIDDYDALAIGAQTAATLLGPARNQAGQRREIVLVRDGETITLTLIAAPTS